MSLKKMVNLPYYYNIHQMTLPFLGKNTLGCWDRNLILSPNTQLTVLRPLGISTAGLSFDGICLKRAEELVGIARAGNKKIWIFWSGGLDSTGAYLALREVASPNEIGVIYSADSLLEHPELWGQIKGVHETFEINMYNIWTGVEFACKDGIAVTGEIGDQLFGSMMFSDYPSDVLRKSWQEWNQEYAANETFQQFVSASPIQISTIQDLLWWINYSSKYQWVQVRMLVNNSISVLDKNIFHFFDSADFNNYTVSTPSEEKMPNADISQYKKPLRDFIARISRDSTYAYNKPKVASLNPVYGKMSNSRVAVAIDTNWQRYYK